MARPLVVACLSHLASRRAPTGAERSLALLAGGLAARGHRVQVVAPGPWTLEEPLVSAGAEVVRIATRPCWMTYWEPVGPLRAAAKWVRYAIPDPGAPRLERLLRRLRPDVVHVNCLPHVRGARAGRRAGRPVIWHLREILPAGARRRWFAGLLREYATLIVAVSEAVGDWVREEGLSGRLTVVPNGVSPPAESIPPDEARARLGLPLDGIVVGLYGQIVPHKGTLEFARVAARVRAAEPSAIFVLAGDGPREHVEAVRRAGEGGTGEGGFRVLPPQPSAETLISASDVVCLTTLSPDPFPRAVLEAMAGSRPVAAFRSGGTPEMVIDGETGSLVEVGDVDGLAAAIVRLIRDPEGRRRMGEAGAGRVAERFSEERHVARMEALMRDLAGR